MIDILRLCRLYYVVPMSLAYTLTVCYALGGAPAAERPAIALSTAALALVIAAAYVFNDVCDRRVDCVNAPHRPIAAQRVTPVAAVAWALGLCAAGLVLAAWCRWQFLLVLAAVATLLLLYDVFSKRLGVGKQLLVAALMTSIYPLAFAQAGGAVGDRAATLAIFPCWMFLTAFGYEALKDIRDIVGDLSATGRLTWIQRRPRFARRVSLLAIFVGALVLVGPRLAGCGSVYMSIAGIAALCAVGTALVPSRWALLMIYTECMLVGIAATADLILAGD